VPAAFLPLPLHPLDCDPGCFVFSRPFWNPPARGIPARAPYEAVPRTAGLPCWRFVGSPPVSLVRLSPRGAPHARGGRPFAWCAPDWLARAKPRGDPRIVNRPIERSCASKTREGRLPGRPKALDFHPFPDTARVIPEGVTMGPRPRLVRRPSPEGAGVRSCPRPLPVVASQRANPLLHANHRQTLGSMEPLPKKGYHEHTLYETRSARPSTLTSKLGWTNRLCHPPLLPREQLRWTPWYAWLPSPRRGQQTDARVTSDQPSEEA
jgi:hypothetical protein